MSQQEKTLCAEIQLHSLKLDFQNLKALILIFSLLSLRVEEDKQILEETISEFLMILDFISYRSA